MTEPAAEAAPNPDDAELMGRVRSGELDRLSELFERHHRRLLGFFVRLVRDREAAEDLVQEVFVRLLKYRRTWRDGAEFTPWLFGIARNAAVDHFRGRPRELPENPDAPEPEAPTEAPDHRVERDERERFLHAALGRLRPERREVLMLARFGELRYDRIGELLGCSSGAVKVRVHRALKELREAYQTVSGEAIP